MKMCNCCLIEKDDSSFYKHPAGALGLSPICRDCARIKTHNNYLKQRDRILQYSKEHWERFKLTPKYAQKLEGFKQRRKQNPLLFSCRRKAYHALETGKISRKPCEVCQTSIAVEMHHDDYAKPLQIRWLCRTHHRQLHENLKK